VVRGVNGPIEISSAELRLLRDEARVEKLSALAGDAHWTGSVALPRGCGTPGACLIRFNLNTDEMDLSELTEWLSSHPSQRRWYQVLTPAEPTAPSFLQNLRASGKVNAGRLLIRNLAANRVSASLGFERGKLKISDLRADLLGGKHRGEWQADFTADSPVYTGTGALTGISLHQVADAMQDPWISGTAEGTYRITASGADSAAFWQSVDGGLQFDVRDGVLSHISLVTDEGPLRISRWQGRARLRDGKIEIENEKLISAAGAYEVSGTASLGQVLDFKLTRSADAGAAHAIAFSVTGTVAEPRVTLTTTETQAKLKP
jgi:AsmA-like C-terminal region